MRDVSVILPCLNEEESIGGNIQKIQSIFKANDLKGEVVVVDNGSTDYSARIAKCFDIKYVFEPRRGYGNACRAGFKLASGKYLILGDPDNSYDFCEIPAFLSHLKKYDVVFGSRFKGQMEKGAMSFLHRRVGNPGIRMLLRYLHGAIVSEPSTGFMGIRRSALEQLALEEPGMEFASEVHVQIQKNNLMLKEIPIRYRRRAGRSKLRTWRDGFRHARFLVKERITR